MKKLLFTTILSVAILGIVATEADAIGCGLFNRSSGERRFTPVRTTVNAARNVTNRVANAVLPRRAERVAARQASLSYTFDGTVETGVVSIRVAGTPQQAICSYGFCPSSK